MKTKPIPLIVSLLFCLSGSAFAELDLSVINYIPITVTHSLRNIQKAENDVVGNTIICGNYRGSLIYGDKKIGSLASNTGTGGGGFGGGNAQDIFIAKFRNKELIWINSIRGEARDFVYDLVIHQDNIYITGITNSRTLLISDKTLTPKWSASSPFCAKFTLDGKLIWFKQLYQTGAGLKLRVKNSSIDIGGFKSGDFGDPNFLITTKSFLVTLNHNGQIVNESSVSIPMSDPLITFGNQKKMFVTSRFNSTNFKFKNEIYSSTSPESLILKTSAGEIDWVKQVGTSMFPRYGDNLIVDKNGNSYIYSTFRKSFFLGTKHIKALASNNAFIAKLNKQGKVQWVVQGEGYLNRLWGLFHPVSNNLILKGYVDNSFKLPNKSYNRFMDILLEINGNGEIVSDFVFPANAIVTGVNTHKDSIFFFSNNVPENLIINETTIQNTPNDMALFELKFHEKEQPNIPINLEGELFFGCRIKGEIGKTYLIQYTLDLNSEKWNDLEYFTLQKEEEVFIDKDGLSGQKRFYRAVHLP